MPSSRLPSQNRQWFLLGAERVELRREAISTPGEGEVIVRIDSALTCGTDLKVYRAGGHARMLHPPCPFGHEMAGTIVSCGSQAGNVWREGERVAIANSASCGSCLPCRAHRENLCRNLRYLNGAFGEYLRIPGAFVDRSMHRVPEGLALRDAALAEPLACVLHMMELLEDDLARWREVPLGAAVLGAGPLGLLITHQLARLGVAVTTADPNPQRLEVARRLGATSVVPLERTPGQDPTMSLPQRLRERTHHLAIDASGTLEGWQAAVGALMPGGTVVFFGGVAAGVLPLRAHTLHYDELTLRGVYHHTPRTFRRALQVLAEGGLQTELLVERTVALDELSASLEAMARREVLKVHVAPHGVEKH